MTFCIHILLLWKYQICLLYHQGRWFERASEKKREKFPHFVCMKFKVLKVEWKLARSLGLLGEKFVCFVGRAEKNFRFVGCVGIGV
jgi:hypothetical protein